MRQERKEWKKQAKRALLGHYDVAACSGLLAYVILFVAALALVLFALLAAAINLVGSGDTEVATASVLLLVVIIVVIYVFILLFAQLLLGAGVSRICYQLYTGEGARLTDLFFGVRHRPLRFIGLFVRLSLIALAVSIPFCILSICGGMWFMRAGIVGMAYGGSLETGPAHIVFMLGTMVISLINVVLLLAVLLRYSMALFILIETPDIRVKEAIQRSKALMEGNKMRLFKLQISFIGIAVLMYMTMGIGSLWALPYMVTTHIAFYFTVKEEKSRREEIPV